MNWNIVEGKWKQVSGNLKDTWGKFTDSDITQLSGKKDHLVGLVQERYGVMKDEAEKQVDAWVEKLNLNDAKEEAKDAGASLKDKAADMVQNVKDKMSDMAQTAQDKAADVSAKTADKTHDVAGKSEKNAHGVIDTVADAANRAVETLANAGKKAADFVSEKASK